jgi:NhaP-type Na+/H+ or K+/H+ antiporter
MDTATLWFILVGSLFLGVAVVGSYVRRLPLSTALLYLAVGLALGPLGLEAIRLDPLEDAAFLERVSEVAVIISLFTAGLKLRIPLLDHRWRPPLRLAFVSMTVTVVAIAFAGVYGIGLSWGAAVLLGAVLAPTDPVLASDVQVEHPFDYDPLRFSLTGEAGLNDGTAFPFVMLGLGLLGLHPIGDWGVRWFLADVVWAIAGGLLIGTLLGTAVARGVLYLRRVHREAVGLDDFLALALIGLSYGVALLCSTYGFLAVFAAGLALRRIERHQRPEEEHASKSVFEAGQSKEEIATDPEKAPAAMAEVVLHFTEQLERMGELVIVVLIGSMLSWKWVPWQAIWFIPVLLLIIRPVSVYVGLLGSAVPALEKRFTGWFGIRGVGSLYYVMYGLVHGVSDGEARMLIGLTLATIVVSALAHGITVTPLMTFYANRTSDARSVS